MRELLDWLKEIHQTEGKTPSQIAYQQKIIDSINKGLGDGPLKLNNLK